MIDCIVPPFLADILPPNVAYIVALASTVLFCVSEVLGLSPKFKSSAVVQLISSLFTKKEL